MRGAHAPGGRARTAPTRNSIFDGHAVGDCAVVILPGHDTPRYRESPNDIRAPARYDMIAHSHAHRLRRPHLLALKQADSRPSPNPLARLLPMVSSPKLLVSPGVSAPRPYHSRSPLW